MKKGPLNSAIRQLVNDSNRKDMFENPPPELVKRTCHSCEFYPTKPGVRVVPAWIVAASNAASRIETSTSAGITVTIDDYSARTWAALEGVLAGRARSERLRNKESTQSTAKTNITSEVEGNMD